MKHKPNPLAQLDANAVAQLNYPQSAKMKDRKRYYASVRSEVQGCTGCQLTTINETTPVPFRVEKGVRPRFVVVGEAPDADEMARGKPFTGDTGKKLHALFRDAGLDWYDALFCNTVSCMPTDDGVKMRGAKKPEIKACRSNLIAQIEAGYTPYVLLVGGKAMDAFRSDLTVTDHHGQCFIWLDSYFVMAVAHPESPRDVLREVVEDLKRWKQIVYGDDDPLKFLGQKCVKCGENAATWDRDGVPWCTKHHVKSQWRDDRERFDGAINEQLRII